MNMKVIKKTINYLCSFFGILFLVQLLFITYHKYFIPNKNITTFTKQLSRGAKTTLEIDGNNVVAQTLGVRTKYRNIITSIANNFSFESYYHSFLGGKILEKNDLGKETLIANLSHPKTFKVSIGFNSYGNNDSGIEIRNNNLEMPLFVIDYNGDGILDHLRYRVFNLSNDPIKTIDDFGMDGQIDYIHDHITGTTSIFYKERWYELEDNKNTIIIDGEVISLESILKFYQKQMQQ